MKNFIKIILLLIHITLSYTVLIFISNITIHTNFLTSLFFGLVTSAIMVSLIYHINSIILFIKDDIY